MLKKVSAEMLSVYIDPPLLYMSPSNSPAELVGWCDTACVYIALLLK